MAKATFDIKTIEIPAVAKRPLYAGVGATDLAVGYVRGYVADVQARFAKTQETVQQTVAGIDLEPKALRDQALTVVSARVDALSKDAKARRAAIEARVAELQDEARALPTKVQSTIDENVVVVTDTYGDLAKRGEALMTRIRRQEATQAAAASAETTVAKAKTTRTQGAKATKTTAKKTVTTAKKTAKKASTTPRSSAKATGTAAKKTVANTAKATTEAAKKVGD